jgi:hypothetical protein
MGVEVATAPDGDASGALLPDDGASGAIEVSDRLPEACAPPLPFPENMRISRFDRS